MNSDFPPDCARPPAALTVPLSWLYRCGNLAHRGIRRFVGVNRLECPVISVGNLTVGGSGKTPFVAALVELLIEIRPELRIHGAIAILSRGYGRQSRALVEVKENSTWQECGDEPLLLKRKLPHAAVVVHPSRVTGGRYAREKFGSQVCILDDGFQHHALARDLDLVVADAARPLGNGMMLPAGPLREPITALRRASAILSVGAGHHATQRIASRFDCSLIRAHSEIILTGELQALKQEPIVLLTGIARSQRVWLQLTELGFSIAHHAVFPDHWPFRRDELATVCERVRAVGAAAVLTTTKDIVRLAEWDHEIPLVPVDMRFIVDDREELLRIMLSIFRQTGREVRET